MSATTIQRRISLRVSARKSSSARLNCLELQALAKGSDAGLRQRDPDAFREVDRYQQMVKGYQGKIRETTEQSS